MNKRLKFILTSWTFTVGGIFGFVYEELFYRLDLGGWVKRGSTFGPWIPIYGFGALLIMLSTYAVRKKPLLVLLISAVVCGLLEFCTGWVLYNCFATRLWDYNTEIWNWLNIDGFVCLRSVLFFGVSGLVLQYAIYPMLKKLEVKLVNKKMQYISLIPCALFVIDMIIYKLCK